MCGIAGIIDLSGRRPAPPGRAAGDGPGHRPSRARRGRLPRAARPRPRHRRLSIVGLADGRQPIFNEDRTVAVVFNGELFDYPERSRPWKPAATASHPLRHRADSAPLGRPRRGDVRAAARPVRRRPVGRPAAAPRPGPRPLRHLSALLDARRGDWLLFASEIKALLASGMVDARPDLRGINHLFTFFALPGPVTCFEGIQLLPPGHFLRIQLGGPGESAQVSEHTYWEIDFPDQGQEDPGDDEKRWSMTSRRCCSARWSGGCGPMCRWCRTSRGGVDSSIVVALASHVRGSPIPTFTISIKDPKLNEKNEASVVARHIGTDPIVVHFGADEVLDTYPGADPRRRRAGGRHLLCRPAAAGPRGPRPRLQGGADRRRGRRVAGRLSVAQGQPRLGSLDVFRPAAVAVAAARLPQG